MITFTIALLILIAGYFFYGRYISNLFGVDTVRTTPALAHTDGIDYVPMPTWKAYMIQFLNIAGLGPIFGAIMGAKFGTASYLWIVLGTLFAGAVHDYLAAMLSLRHDGESLPQLVGRYLGKNIRIVFTVFVLILMILVGAIFVSQPADLLANLTPKSLNVNFWIVAIFIYYLIATMFPIDKIIGTIYPIFAFALLFMAVGILLALYLNRPDLPEMWNGFGVKYEKLPIFPMMFISIACGAISGFHATQSPLMARCIKNEKNGHFVFYGAMVTEGIVALIWAAAATTYFHKHGAAEGASTIVMNISKTWLGAAGGLLAVLGVIAAPISTGDTALRSARLMLSEIFHIEQQTLSKRLAISVPLFLITAAVLSYSITNPDGFSVIWRYFAWCNQVLSVFTLWALTVFLSKVGKNFYVTIIPAIWMTMVTTTYICVAPEGFGLNALLSYSIGAAFSLGLSALFFRWKLLYRQGKVAM